MRTHINHQAYYAHIINKVYDMFFHSNLQGWGGSPGQVVMGDVQVQEVVGSNPGAVYWMEMAFFTLNLL